MTGKSRKDTAKQMGITFRTVQRPRIKSEGHQAVRKLFPRLWLDDRRAEHGVNGIACYQHEWDDKKKVFKDQPLHDWASHPADALQTLALGWQETMTPGVRPNKPTVAKVSFNVFG